MDAMTFDLAQRSMLRTGLNPTHQMLRGNIIVEKEGFYHEIDVTERSRWFGLIGIGRKPAGFGPGR